ncbi:MAG: hypothetical protein U0169_00785 [Polyangiaceae bacterium]
MPSRPPPGDESEPPPPDTDEGEGLHAPVVVRFGTAIAMAVVAAVLATGPAVLRIAHDPSSELSNLRAWCALAALAFVPMLFGVLVLRGARVGIRAFTGRGATGRGVIALATVSAVFVTQLLFASLLRTHTHHHALAGATFAIVALGSSVVLGVFVSRAYRLASSAGGSVRSVLLAAFGVAAACLFVVAIALVARSLRADVRAPSPLGTFIVDALAFGIACVFASRPSASKSTPLAFAGPPLVALAFVAGMTGIRTSPNLRSLIRLRAPSYAMGLDAMGYVDPKAAMPSLSDDASASPTMETPDPSGTSGAPPGALPEH